MSRFLTERATRRPRARRVVAAVVGLVSVLLLSGCSQAQEDQWKRLGLPVAASDRSPYMETLWVGAWIAAFVVGGLVWGLIVYVVIRYRRRSEDEVPTQVRYHLPIEVLYTITPLIAVAVLFFFTVEKQDKIKAPVAHPDHTVIVTAQQWSWTFNYMHEPAAGGTPVVYDAGTVATIPQLWLVKGQSVTFDLHSPDVIHSFWVPEFYFKLDVIPGRDQAFSMTPTRYGVYEAHCAELCGFQHSRMLFDVHVVNQATFAKHIRRLKAEGNVSRTPLLGGSNSRTVSGLQAAQGESE